MLWVKVVWVVIPLSTVLLLISGYTGIGIFLMLGWIEFRLIANGLYGYMMRTKEAVFFKKLRDKEAYLEKQIKVLNKAILVGGTDAQTENNLSGRIETTRTP